MVALLAALLILVDTIPAPIPADPEAPGVPWTNPAAPGRETASGASVSIESSFMPKLPTRLGPRPLLAPEEPQLIEYSDAYLARLEIHKYASYATLPLFAAAYVTGNELITKGGHAASWARNTHGAIAGGLGVLFAVNTITGVWNLYEGRHDPEGRTRRIIHSVLLLAADAGFLATAALAGESEGGEGGGEWHGVGGDNSAHRAMAITSMGLALTGYMTMSWPFRRE
jgi:hypothetical protein